MNKRLFTFGCSFTSWKWPTWNDYIALNFDEYYTLGCGGADNKNILCRLLQSDRKFKFTSDDCVIVMFSSFNRMSYIDKHNFHIYNIGDLIDQNINAHPIGKNYNFATAVYDNCIAIQSVESILKSKNIKYEFLQSMDWNSHQDNFEMGGDIKNELDYDEKQLNNFEDAIKQIKLNKNWDKKAIVNEFFKIIPGFNYQDNGKYLDGKM